MVSLEERRRHTRWSLSLKATARALSQYPSTPSEATSAQARVENISDGGVGLVTDSELPVSALVDCRLHVTSVPIPIPTLLIVRWSRKRRSGRRHDVGLQFLV
jgi:c-di-GMP-binding flagellar brake protein YcgR